MYFRSIVKAALILSAALAYPSYTQAQAPIVDASVDANASGAPASSQSPAGSSDQGSGVDQGELFYQLQLLQQEIMQLRGQVEEQAYQLQQLKNQSMERYIDLDKRIASVSSHAPAKSAKDNDRAAPTGLARKAATVVRAGEKAAYDGAYSLMTGKQFDAALEAFKQFLVDFPDGKYAPNAYYWMGELYQVVVPADLEAAREVFTQLLTQYPDHAKAADAMYKLGKVYLMMGNRATAREWLEKVIANYSDGPHASTAQKARQFLNANL